METNSDINKLTSGKAIEYENSYIWWIVQVAALVLQQVIMLYFFLHYGVKKGKLSKFPERKSKLTETSRSSVNLDDNDNLLDALDTGELDVN